MNYEKENKSFHKWQQSASQQEGVRFLFSDFFHSLLIQQMPESLKSLCFCLKFYLARICISKSLQFSYPQKAYLVLWITKLYVWQILVKDDRGPEPLWPKQDTESCVGHGTDLTAIQSSHVVGIWLLWWKKGNMLPKSLKLQKSSCSLLR